MFRRVFVVLFFGIVAVLAAGSAWAVSPALELEGRYWVTSLSGHVQVYDSSATATDIDLKNDLKIGNKDVPDLRLTWHTGEDSWLRLAYTHLSYSGDNPSLASQIVFRGHTYDVNTHVTSSLKVDYASLDWAWQFINIKNVLKFGTLISAKGFWTDASIDDVTTNISESKNIDFGLPTVGAALDINPVSFVDIFGDFSWITAGKYGHMYDTEGGVKIIPIKYLSITGGYRIFDLTAKDNSDFASVKIEGPFAGATLRF